jgi:hypothetical protein
MGSKTHRVPKLPIASQTFKNKPTAKSEPEEGVVLQQSSMVRSARSSYSRTCSDCVQMKTENALKGLSINPNNEISLNYKSSKGKGKVVDRRSWEDLLEENECLKQQLETTRDCWSTDKRVLESKVKDLEEKLKEALEKGNKSRGQEIGDSAHVSNVEIESNNYEKLYKAVKEELRCARPLIQVGAAVRHHYLERSQKKLASWYSMEAFYNTINIPVRDAAFAAENNPNPNADLALYQCGFLDPKNRADLKPFVELYKLDVNVAMQQRILESRSQEYLCILRAMLFTTTKSSLGPRLANFNLNSCIEEFLRLDQDITFLCPKMVEEGKPLYGDNEEPVEDPRVWDKIREIEAILSFLGLPEEDKHHRSH